MLTLSTRVCRMHHISRSHNAAPASPIVYAIWHAYVPCAYKIIHTSYDGMASVCHTTIYKAVLPLHTVT